MYLGAKYTSKCALTAVTAQRDLIDITCAAAGIVIPDELQIVQTNVIKDAGEDNIVLTWLRGFTTAGSGGATVVTSPANSAATHSGLPTVLLLNTTLATTTTPTEHGSYQWNVRGGLHLPFGIPPPWVLRNSERMVLRMDAAPLASVSIGVSFSYWVV